MPYLTPDELKSIKDLQSKYNQTILEIGAAEAQLIVFLENIEKLQEAKKGLVSDLKTLEQKESELVKTLQEKYGAASIDPQTGELTPIQQ
jgi:hypothetical protein